MNRGYQFSVIIPIHKGCKYLQETLDSVIEQEIGFCENVQMILVDAAGTEDYEQICQSYQTRFPENIVYTKQEKDSIGAAKNRGMEFVQGKYVNFLDVEDKWTKKSFGEVSSFFKSHPEIDVAACPRKVFEGKEEGIDHYPYKWGKENRIVNLTENYKWIQNQATSLFVKSEVIAKHKFDEQMQYCEGAKWINTILLEKMQYGVVAKAQYLCRRREERDGFFQKRTSVKSWFLEVPRQYYLGLIQQSKEQKNCVPPYIQYLILSDFQWRLREDLTKCLSSGEQDKYIECLREMLSYMDVPMICQPDKMYVEYKLYALSLKLDYDIREDLIEKNGGLYFQETKIYSLQARSLISMDVIEIRNNHLQVAGRIWSPVADDLNIFMESDGGKRYEICGKPASVRKATILGKEMIRVRGFELELPLDGVTSYRFLGCYREGKPQQLNPRLGKFSRLSLELEESYYHREDWILQYDKLNAKLIILKNALCARFCKELKLLKRCLCDKKWSIAWYRLLAHFIKPLLRKQRWLVMERIHVAGDNAEHFYKYLKTQKLPDIKSFFVIARDSKDYERMASVGTVYPYRGFMHKFNFLLTDKLISSQGEDNLMNPWDEDGIYVRDMYKYQFVFLQHGIIKDDLSAWLNKFNKNLHMFVTSAKPEYESILAADYFYDESVVKLTGLPRYDELKQDITKEKTILILPTWRSRLAGKVNNDTGEREYNPNFKYSEFFLFYSRLIQDERLLGAMQKYGYKGRFFLHTQHSVQMRDFTDNETIQIMREGINYQEEFQKEALLLTDFSSVAFDFAYLKKPVIYTHFDRDTFFDGQIYSEGYFDYERDGMGPVCYDYESTVQKIVEYIESDCVLDSLYDERGNAFYNWFDSNNCQRVYEAIRGMDESSSLHLR